MLKCPIPGYPVVVAPERGREKPSSQNLALVNHLKGKKTRSQWFACARHEIGAGSAREIADKAVELFEIVVARRRYV